ncbi:fibronectin type III domain-containing protein [Geopsychrobacter electrodiphilus]|uniref:fibronectin type III domain-containing protein n=1 Tax=Geopsychrobacter electrodiphilus TaxID=225196 RepID=UPI00037B484C|nr:hypothetical protein [Geopsychrobacter electrodiphilus]
MCRNTGFVRSKMFSILKRWGGLALLCLFTSLLAACGGSSSSPSSELVSPTISAVTAGDGTATIEWSDVSGATDYNLYAGLTSGVTPATGVKIASVVSPYTVTGLENGTRYFCVLTAVHPTGESKGSAEASVTLAPNGPESVAVTAGNLQEGEVFTPYVDIEWADVLVGATSYTLYKSIVAPVTIASPSTVDVTSPYRDLDVVHDTTYYYMLTAVGAGGESLPSQQVSALPRLPLNAPVNVSAVLTAETTRSITLSWSQPLIGAVPDSYNIYRAVTTPVAVDPANLVTDGVVATSYIDNVGLVGGTTYYYTLTAVAGSVESSPSAEVSATPRGSQSTTGGGGDSGFGNNLSLPLVFADGYGLTGAEISTTIVPPYSLTNIDPNTGLRPTAEELVSLTAFPNFDPDNIYSLNAVDYYEQQTASTWQADWVNGIASDPTAVQEVTVNWGDNLASVSFSENSVVRVETVLYQDPPDTLTAYTMDLLYGSGVTEMQGTSAVLYETTRRNVYAVTARLTIDKLDGPGGNVVFTHFDKAVWENYGSDGPGGYSAEINVGGSLVFGYNWMLNQDSLPPGALKPGWWRLTFSLDDSATIGTSTVNNHTRLTALDPSDAAAVLDPAGQWTSIEVEVR